MKWDATGGKSGSAFLKTRDDRFIMKQLSKVELEAFIKFAPHYFEYMHKAIYHKVQSSSFFCILVFAILCFVLWNVRC